MKYVCVFLGLLLGYTFIYVGMSKFTTGLTMSESG